MLHAWQVGGRVRYRKHATVVGADLGEIVAVVARLLLRFLGKGLRQQLLAARLLCRCQSLLQMGDRVAGVLDRLCVGAGSRRKAPGLVHLRSWYAVGGQLVDSWCAAGGAVGGQLVDNWWTVGAQLVNSWWDSWWTVGAQLVDSWWTDGAQLVDRWWAISGRSVGRLGAARTTMSRSLLPLCDVLPLTILNPEPTGTLRISAGVIQVDPNTVARSLRKAFWRGEPCWR